MVEGGRWQVPLFCYSGVPAAIQAWKLANSVAEAAPKPRGILFATIEEYELEALALAFA